MQVVKKAQIRYNSEIKWKRTKIRTKIIFAIMVKKAQIRYNSVYLSSFYLFICII